MSNETRERIIAVGADIIHRQGYTKTGIKEILDAAGVPKGSFYFYFPSKEDFGLAVVEHFISFFGDIVRTRLGDEALAPLDRLRTMFRSFHQRFAEQGYERGCPIGNLGQEMSDLSPRFRERLERAFTGMALGIRRVLEQARVRDELPEELVPEAAANFILAAWEGALLRMKTAKSGAPLDCFEDMIFNHLLKK